MHARRQAPHALFIVAVKANPLDPNFAPRVDYEMPLGRGRKASA